MKKAYILEGDFRRENVYLQTLNIYIYIYNMNFKNLTVGLHVLIIFFVLTKFQEDKKLIAMLSITCLNFKFLW